MIYNQTNQMLYTDDGQPIKQLACPYKTSDIKLTRTGLKTVSCRNCDHTLILAHTYSESELLEMTQADPYLCLLLDFSSGQIKRDEVELRVR